MRVYIARIVLVAGVALVGSVAADAQDAKQPPDLRMLLVQPQNRLPADSAGVPNLRDVPMPKMDKPPVQPPVTIMLGDPRCYPGEDGPGDFPPPNRRLRRSR